MDNEFNQSINRSASATSKLNSYYIFREMIRSGQDCPKSEVFRHWQKMVSDGADVFSSAGCSSGTSTPAGY